MDETIYVIILKLLFDFALEVWFSIYIILFLAKLLFAVKFAVECATCWLEAKCDHCKS